MTDYNRRSTMQPAADPHGNARSGIPQPIAVPSTVKKSQNLRMSMAGPAIRGPSHNLAGPPSNPRQSMLRSQNVNPLLASTTKQSYGRTPMSTSTRRVSVWAGGAQPSILPNPQQQSIKDSRPLRERQYQARMRLDIHNFLLSTSYDIDIRVLLNITGKDFRSIVFHLIYLIDPGYLFSEKARFEDEFVVTLKAVRYPFAGSIDAKWLAAPASMHSWPFLLGALHWLCELARLRIATLDSGHPANQLPSEVPDEFHEEDHYRALAFDYTTAAYEAFLDGNDTYEEQDQMLEARFMKKDESVIDDLDRRKDDLGHAKLEAEKLEKSAAPIEKLLKENNVLKDDMEKFRRILKQYDARKQKLTDTLAHEKEELAARDADLEQFKADQEKLSQIVKTQNLTPEEVIRMNTDHEMLQRNLADLKDKITDAHKTVMTLEVNVTNRAAAAEEALDAYNNFLSSLGLFPPLPPPWQDIDLALDLNTGLSNLGALLGGADVKKVVKPTLSGYAESKRAERARVESDRIKVDNELDQLTLECENVDEEITEVEKKVGGLNEQAEDLRDAAQQEAIVNNGEASRLERELAHARTAALANGMGVKSRLQAVQVEYREQMDKVARLREETVRAIVKNSTDMGIFKEEVSRHLKQLKEFAEGD